MTIVAGLSSGRPVSRATDGVSDVFTAFPDQDNISEAGQ